MEIAIKMVTAFILLFYTFPSEQFSTSQISLMGQTTYEKAAVVTNSVPCTGIALDVLQDGGSAVDAAIAAALCDGIMNPQSMGIGGGFLATVYDKTKGISEVLNAREIAPKAADKNMFKDISDKKGAVFRGLTIAVPGELVGYYELHKKYGKSPWKSLFQPTIALCRHGVIVTSYTGTIISKLEERIMAEPTLKQELTNPETGLLYKAGDVMIRNVLANTLELVAARGPQILYNGGLTARFIEDIKSFHGIITADDLKNYKPRWQNPIVKNFSDFIIHTTPSPGSGTILVLILDTLSKVIAQGNPVIIWHRILEIWKYAYALKTKFSGPFFYPNEKCRINDEVVPFHCNMSDFIKMQINEEKTSNNSKDYFEPYKSTKDFGTGHICVLAPNGDAVSLTSTINEGFGSLFVSPSTGIILNNEMLDFSMPDLNSVLENPNGYIGPYKQPTSSMCPSILTDPKTKQVLLVIGGSGGLKILSAVSSVIIRHFWFHDGLSRAIYSERLHHQLLPMVVEYEEGFPVEIIKGLQSKGHGFRRLPKHKGSKGCQNNSTELEFKFIRSSVNGISVKGEGDEIYAVADPRRAAAGAGF